MKRIHIIGSVGSGKTTLARRLSSEMGLPFYELDNVVWKRPPAGDVRRTDEERDVCLAEIVGVDDWITEGAHQVGWIGPCLERAERIVFLDTPYSTRLKRIISRFIRQKTGRERANYKPTWTILCRMFRWNHRFQREGRLEAMELLKPHEHKMLILKDNRLPHASILADARKESRSALRQNVLPRPTIHKKINRTKEK
ncbi:P-loop NTPase family protein [Paenibacillus chitinolyticus]|uniref:DNA topology modulation protein FlaR n=1 Tax=Paenibacillus chitinolyticus TaxID=79263 RepID=UPI0036577B70